MTGNVSQAWRYSATVGQDLPGVSALKIKGDNLWVGAQDRFAVYPLPGLKQRTSIPTKGTIDKIVTGKDYLFARLGRTAGYSLAKYSIEPLQEVGVLDAPVYDFDADEENLYVVTNSSTVSVYSQSELKPVATYNLADVQYCTIAIANKVLCVASGGQKQNVVQFYTLDGSQKLGEVTTELHAPKVRVTSGGNFLLTDASVMDPKSLFELYNSCTYSLQSSIDYVPVLGGVLDFSESNGQLFFAGNGVHLVGNSIGLEAQGSFTLSDSYQPCAIAAFEENTVFASAGFTQMGIDVWIKSETTTSKE